MTTLLSISALLITVMLMQMGTGALGPLDTLSAIELGFSNIQIGIIGAAHFTGFIIGCFGLTKLLDANMFKFPAHLFSLQKQ